MKCPSCKTEELQDPITIGSVPVNHCKICSGMWFDKNELRLAKDEEARYAKWFDFDLWSDASLFKASKSERICPIDATLLVTLAYDNSDVKIDVCKECHGVWLDKNEFVRIIDYVKRESDYEVLSDYTKNLMEEGLEVFNGPEGFYSELTDLKLLLEMFKYKFAVQHPNLTQVLTQLPLV